MKNILASCTFVDVIIDELPEDLKQKVIEAYELEEDEPVVRITEEEVDYLEIPYECLDDDSWDFNTKKLSYVLHDYLGKHPWYLVVAKHCTWNGMSGYKFFRDTHIVNTVTRDYDITLLLEQRGKDAILCTESSHDVPQGSSTYIIGISEEEYERLSEADYSEIEKFAESKF